MNFYSPDAILLEHRYRTAEAERIAALHRDEIARHPSMFSREVRPLADAVTVRHGITSIETPPADLGRAA